MDADQTKPPKEIKAPAMELPPLTDMPDTSAEEEAPPPPPEPRPEPDIDFIVSYKESDASYGEAVAHVLGEAGYRIECRPWAYTASRVFLDEMRNRGHDGTCLVPILTPAYMTTIHAEHFWFEAFKRGQFPTLPIWAHECEIDNLLFIHEFVDMRHGQVAKVRNSLLEMAVEHRGQPRGQIAVVHHKPQARPKIKLEDLQPMRRVPFERPKEFVANGSLFRDIRDALERKRIALLLGTTHGGKGHGLRATSIEFLYQYASEFPLIWVMRANHPAVLAEDYAQLASVLNLPEADARDQAYTAQAVRRWLSENQRWLLLFYHAENFEAVEEYIPYNNQGHVLIVGQDGDWPEVERHFHVQGWSRTDAAKYLIGRTVASDEKFAEEIGELLEYTPLSLSIAADYILQSRVSLDEYATLLRDRIQKLHGMSGAGKEVPIPLECALSLTIERLAESTPEIFDFLKGFAYLDSHNILIGLFAEGGKSLPKNLARALQDPESIKANVEAMKRWGVLEERFGSIFIHPLVGACVRRWLEMAPGNEIHEIFTELSAAQSFSLAKPEGPLWLKRMLKLMVSAFPDDSNDKSSWLRASRLLPHAYELLRHGDRLGGLREYRAELQRRLGEYLMHRELLKSALAAFEASRKVDGGHIAAGKRRLAVLMGLGQTLTYSGRYDAAAECLEEARKLAAGALGRGTPDLSEVYVLLGNVRRRCKDYEHALEYYGKALEIDQKLHGSDHEDTLRDFILIGLTWKEKGDLSKAWASFDEAQGIQERVFGPDHISLARVSKGLGQVFHAMGDLERARDCFSRAIQVTRAIHGLGHPSVAESYEEYGDVLMSSGDIPGARRAFKQAFRTTEAVYGAADRRIAELAMKLGNTAKALEMPAKADAAYQRALQVFQRNGGDSDEGTVRAREAIATLAK